MPPDEAADTFTFNILATHFGQAIVKPKIGRAVLDSLAHPIDRGRFGIPPIVFTSENQFPIEVVVLRLHLLRSIESHIANDLAPFSEEVVSNQFSLLIPFQQFSVEYAVFKSHFSHSR